jgi:hypothetical protein
MLRPAQPNAFGAVLACNVRVVGRVGVRSNAELLLNGTPARFAVARTSSVHSNRHVELAAEFGLDQIHLT